MQVDFTFEEKVMNKHLLIEQIAAGAGISLEEASAALEKFAAAMVQWEPCTEADFCDLERKLNSIIPECEPVPLEPLWVRNQQQKSFKRGKK